MISNKCPFTLPDPCLTAELEDRLALTATDAAHVDLVMGNIKHGFGYARIYCTTRFDDDELLSVVYRAMIAAAPRFRPGRQRFIAYCKPFIRGELHRAWKQKAPCGIPMPEFSPPVSGAYGPDDESDPGVIEPIYTTFNFHPLDRENIQKKLAPFLNRLTTQERLVIDLMYTGGYGKSDIAELTKGKRQAIHQVWRRAMRKLKMWVK